MTLRGMIILLFPQVIKWRNNRITLKMSLVLFALCHSDEEITNLQVKNNS